MVKGNVELITAELRDLARGSSRIAQVIESVESRYGDIGEALDRLEWRESDMAFLTWVKKDGTPEAVCKNVMAGQLVTALERGFLPIALAEYNKLNGLESPLEAGGDVRSNTGERAQPPVITDESDAIRQIDHICRPCDRIFRTAKGLQRHNQSPSHISQMNEIVNV